MVFEIKIKRKYLNEETGEYDFTFDYEVRSISSQLFRFEADDYSAAQKLIVPEEVEYLNAITFPTFGEVIS